MYNYQISPKECTKFIEFGNHLYYEICLNQNSLFILSVVQCLIFLSRSGLVLQRIQKHISTLMDCLQVTALHALRGMNLYVINDTLQRVGPRLQQPLHSTTVTNPSTRSENYCKKLLMTILQYFGTCCTVMNDLLWFHRHSTHCRFAPVTFSGVTNYSKTNFKEAMIAVFQCRKLGQVELSLCALEAFACPHSPFIQIMPHFSYGFSYLNAREHHNAGC